MNKFLGMLLLVFAMATTELMAQPVDKVVAANYAPLMIEGDENRPGYAIEVFREASRRAGRAFDLEFLPFQRAMYAVSNDPATLMPALFYGKKHNESFLWVAEIQNAKMRFATTSEQIDSVEAARSLSSIVVESATTADTLLTDLGFENLVRVQSPNSSARMLEAGRVDAWFQNEGVIKQVWQRLELSERPEFGDITHEVPIFLVASSTLPDEIKAAYQTAVQSMKSDGTLDQIWKRYDPG